MICIAVLFIYPPVSICSASFSIPHPPPKMPELRQRQPRETAKIVELSSDDDDDEVTSSTPTLAERAKEEDSSFSLLDIARSIVFVLLLTGATSYFITRTSLTWNVSLPRWTRPEVIQAWIVRRLPSIAVFFCRTYSANSIYRRALLDTPRRSSRHLTAPTRKSPFY